MLDFSRARIAVIGDCMTDVWHFGQWSKITGEGIPAFRVDRTEERPGGAANVKAGIEALGAKASLFGKPEAEWPRKVRYSAHGTVFRADMEDCRPIDESLARSIMASLEASGSFEIIVLSDYAKGVCTPELCRAVIDTGTRVIVDPKGKDWKKYRGASVITPNEREFKWGIWDPFSGYRINAILQTLGSRGMELTMAGGGGKPIEIPAKAREVFDVVGAGDTVIAALACCMAINIPLPEAARIANAAAGVVVSKRGTATCSLAELEAAL